jgi:PAS domain S-box-containing protein
MSISVHAEKAFMNAEGFDTHAESGTPGAGAGATSHDDDLINILLVDDEPKNLTVLETVLEDPGYRLVRAQSPEEALLALVGQEFALLVLDIQMPGMTGFELAQLIKQRKKTAGVPIIFLTAFYSEDQHVLEGYGTGAVDYLHKPINPTILRCKVAVFAELHRRNRETARANQFLRNEVAARRRAEELLQQLNEDLEQRVAERTASLLQREREMHSLADNTPDILTRFDRELRYVFVNSAIEKATGRRPAEFPGRAIREVGLPEDVCDVWERSLRYVFDTKKPRSFEFGHPGPDGLRLYTTRLVPEFGASADPELVLGVTQDITDQKHAEESLKNADRRKDEFLATLAHELRNPLAPLRTGLQVLNVTHDSAVADDTRKMMERQLSHMVRLIDDLMDVSRISSDKLTLRKERVSLQAVVESAVEASRPFIEAAGHRLNVAVPNEPVSLAADPTRLAQVLGNLLTNAAKYTPNGGRIDLVAAREASKAVVRVTDSGLGIPPEMRARVFEMFTQVNRTLERSQGGLGIGLALVKRIVELHGGTIVVQSGGLGKGSTFTVSIPRVDAGSTETEPRATPGAPPAQPSVSRRRVLVVDDNVDGAESLSRLLQICGHETRTAHTGPDGLEASRSFNPEVVFLDIGLPGISGYEVAKQLRGDPSLNGIVLIALTGWGTEDTKRRSREAGFDLHLTKPVEIKAIEGILARLGRSGD